MTKKYILILTLISAELLGAASANAQRCADSSWNPELYSFYGAKETIIKKLAKIPAKLSERRVFLQVTQGDAGADARLYERQEGGTFNVTEWGTKQTAHLLSDIDDAIITNQGVNCVGEQVKEVLKEKLGEGKVSEKIPAPASPEGAFAHPVDKASGKFIKTTIVILC
jgi:hypothetical protein